MLAGFSGTFGVVLREAVKGFDVWADDVNSRGGIHGRQVVVKKVDHKETAEGGVAACKEVLNNGSFTAIIAEGQGDANVTGAHCLDDAGFVHLAVLPAIDPDLTTAYTILPATTDQGSSLASFVKNVMGDGERKIGVIHLKPPAYVQGKDAFVNEARKLGMDVVAQEAIEENQASFTPQLIRIRDAGAETVAIIATYEAAGILRDAKAIGYEPHWTGIVWLFDFVSQASGGTASGARGLRFSATIDSPVYGEFQATAAKQGRSGLTDGEALINYGYGLLMGRVLEAAGPQPTLETLRSGIEAINNYFNGVLPPITWGPGDPVGPTASFPAACCGADNTWKSLGPPKDRF